MDLAKIMDRIRHLLAMAADQRTDPAEAALAAHHAQRLMQAYQIEHADVLLAKAKKADEAEFGTVDVVAKMKRNVDNGHKAQRLPQWASWIAVRCAQLNDCNIIIQWTPDKGVVARFQGFAADAQVAAWMYDYLLNCLINDLRAWQRETYRTKADSSAYRIAYSTTLCARLRDMDTARQADMQQHGASAGALVVAKGNAVAQHFGAAEYKSTKSSAGDAGSASAWAAGRDAGRKVDINRRGLSNSGGSTGRILLGSK